MGIRPEVLNGVADHNVLDAPVEQTAATSRVAGWDSGPLSEDQICRLMRQLFFPASGRAPKQVVFSAVDQSADVGGICIQVAEMLSAHVAATVGAVEASSFSRDTSHGLKIQPSGTDSGWGFGWTRGASEQLTENLWFVPGPVFWAGGATVGTPPWVRDRLAELRMDFDFTLLHAPPAGLYSGTSLLGQASDGLVLVLEANITRKAAAMKTKEALHAASVRLLGTVLSGRTFPIPEAIYQRI
jgi:hypothetical protein